MQQLPDCVHKKDGTIRTRCRPNKFIGLRGLWIPVRLGKPAIAGIHDPDWLALGLFVEI
ncbi:MAG: hypothetical protein AAF283_12020 [Cyanobacteria bacterium P01_A01_bin.70]